MTVYDEFPVLKPVSQRRRPPMDPDNKSYSRPKSIWDNTKSDDENSDDINLQLLNRAKPCV